ncbi:MAG: DUF262 domain-containing protein [Syntrophobacteraceae bacterium]
MAENSYVQDIEESEDILDSSEGDPIDFWEKKQRELVTSVVDYNLGTMAELVATQGIDISPSYQRRSRWDDARQSKLIESFLMNVPVPPIFLNEDAYGHYSVIDGKQRLLSVYEFLRGRLRLRNLQVFADINGLTFDDLPRQLRMIIKTRAVLRAIIILRQSDVDIKFEVFKRLNTGGITLNSQEIRNSTYPGPLNDLILDLSEHKKFHALLGIKTKSRSAIYQEMRDAEFVLRYFTFRDNWDNFSGGMKRCMDEFMVDNQKPTREDIEAYRLDFLNTIDVVEACFGLVAFRRWVPERGQWRKQVLASLFDAQMFACRGLSADSMAEKREEIVRKLKTLFENPSFRRAIDAATNQSSHFRARISMVKMLLQGA